MKIVCDNCATKYSIADEKVRGKVFKIRCKKCSHIIVVRGNEGGEAPAEGAGEGYADEQATVAAGPGAPATGGGSGDSVWHLVIDREQVGPMTPAEVRAKVAAGQADAETYAWREGFGDWLRLASIDEFKDLGGGAPRTIHDAATEHGGGADSTRRSDPADVFASQQKEEDDGGAADLFGGAKAPAPASASFAAAASSSGGDDLFSGAPTAASASPAPGLFGAPAAEAPRARAAASPFGGGGGGASVGDNGGGSAVEAKMTGQRNENSVLFSLNNLQALATSGSGGGSKQAAEPAPRPGYASSKNEGSGLIDIRAMAAQTLSAAPSSSSSNDAADIPAFSAAPVFSPVVAAPILMPTPSTGMPKWVWGVLGGGVLVVGAVVVLLVVVLKKPPEPSPNSALLAQLEEKLNKQTATNGLGAAPTAGTKTGDTPAPKADTPPGDTKPATDKVVAEKDDKKGHGSSKPAAVGGSKHGSSSAKKDDPAAPPPSAPVATPAPEKKKPKGGDTLDDLLDGATGGSKPSAPSRPAKAAEPADDPNLPDQLGRGDIVAGMGGIKGKVDSCAAQYHVPGTAMVQVTIGKTGRVSSATVGGALAGTPSGDCVARAVKSASFKKFKGAPMSIAYPFILRP